LDKKETGILAWALVEIPLAIEPLTALVRIFSDAVPDWPL